MAEPVHVEIDDLPMAEELVETPTTVRTLVLSLLAKPDTATVCALMDLLDESERHEDARELLKILRDLCANGKNNPLVFWYSAKSAIGVLFHFDLHGFTESLDTTFATIEKVVKSHPSGSGVTAGSGQFAATAGSSYMWNPYFVLTNFGGTNSQG